MESPVKPRLACPKRGHWVSFRLIDEHGDGAPYAGLSYVVYDQQGEAYPGTLDAEGFARVTNCYIGPVVLSLLSEYSGGETWYEHLQDRKAFKLPLTALQVAAEQSPLGPRKAVTGRTYLAEARAEREAASFWRVEVSDFAEASAHLPDPDLEWGPRPSASLRLNAGAAATRLGVGLLPNQHHVLEVKALRAYSPLLSRDKPFCALNAYHLSLLSVLAYAPFSQANSPRGGLPPPYPVAGSIGQVLRERLGRGLLPRQFNTAAPYHLLCEEVAYSKRLEVVPYDPARYVAEAERGWKNPENVHFLDHRATDTQAFISHNERIVLISVRGTQELINDGLRDMDARQVPFEEGDGQVHRGFYGAFLAAKDFIERYLRAFYLPEQTLIVCGHSLGGAIALQVAEWLRREWSHDNTLLYTFGSPRVGDTQFVKAAQGLAHHRLVNHNDPVPGVPFTWLDAEWRLALLGSALLSSQPFGGLLLLLGGLLNLRGDPYQHHGEQRHFMPRRAEAGSEAAILWQPGCEALDEQACSQYAGHIDLKGDMPVRESLVKQVASAGDHSSDSGYSRAALTTLLRWNASLERDGALFSDAERHDLLLQVQNLREAMADWRINSFVAFKRTIRRDIRFYRMTDTQLYELYLETKSRVQRVSHEQLLKLERLLRRLQVQSLREIKPADVFGEFSTRADLAEIVADWRGQAVNIKAEQLARTGGPSRQRYG
ncbi:lipase family protein [Metapseudomonas otitidis]|uniref:lipase family protein n=1 Tax=Metapseudomonas otitidis TaxID=319939 RepID=UPI0039FD6814